MKTIAQATYRKLAAVLKWFKPTKPAKPPIRPPVFKTPFYY